MNLVWALVAMVCPTKATGEHCRLVGDRPHESQADCEWFRTHIETEVMGRKANEQIVKVCVQVPDRWGF